MDAKVQPVIGALHAQRVQGRVRSRAVAAERLHQEALVDAQTEAGALAPQRVALDRALVDALVSRRDVFLAVDLAAHVVLPHAVVLDGLLRDCRVHGGLHVDLCSRDTYTCIHTLASPCLS